MGVTPLALARSLRLTCNRRQAVTEVGRTVLNADGKAGTFLVYDNDGGILSVTVSQYKEPLR